MVKGVKTVDRPTVNQAGRAFQFFSAILVGVMFFLGVVMIFLLLSPYFGKQIIAPIKPVPCQLINESAQSEKSKYRSECYKVEDVLALNKALNLSDTLSMFGLLLALFAFITPIFSFFTLKKEKERLEELVEKNELVIQKKMDDLVISSLKEIKNSITLSIDKYPKILSSIEVFKLTYQIDKHKKRSATIDAHMISLHLTSFLDSRASAQEAFDSIDSYIRENSVIDNKQHIIALKKALRELYEAACFDSDGRKKALLEFLEGSLKTSHENFLKD